MRIGSMKRRQGLLAGGCALGVVLTGGAVWGATAQGSTVGVTTAASTGNVASGSTPVTVPAAPVLVGDHSHADIEMRLREIENGLGAGTEIGGIEGRLADIERRLGNQFNNFGLGDMESRLDKIESRLGNGFDSNPFAGVESRVADMEREISALQRQIDDLERSQRY